MYIVNQRCNPGALHLPCKAPLCWMKRSRSVQGGDTRLSTSSLLMVGVSSSKGTGHFKLKKKQGKTHGNFTRTAGRTGTWTHDTGADTNELIAKRNHNYKLRKTLKLFFKICFFFSVFHVRKWHHWLIVIAHIHGVGEASGWLSQIVIQKKKISTISYE